MPFRKKHFNKLIIFFAEGNIVFLIGFHLTPTSVKELIVLQIGHVAACAALKEINIVAFEFSFLLRINCIQCSPQRHEAIE